MRIVDYARYTNGVVESKFSMNKSGDAKIEFTHESMSKITNIPPDWFKYSTGALFLPRLNEARLISHMESFGNKSCGSVRDEWRSKNNLACVELMMGENGKIKDEVQNNPFIKRYSKAFPAWWRRRGKDIKEAFEKVKAVKA